MSVANTNLVLLFGLGTIVLVLGVVNVLRLLDQYYEHKRRWPGE